MVGRADGTEFSCHLVRGSPRVSRLIVFNKPFGVVCQFSRSGDRPTLADFVQVPEVYPAGRLDADSEGLLLLTDHGPWQALISQPRFKLRKTYLVQVEGIPHPKALARLAEGIRLRDGPTLPCEARRIEAPDWLWPRHPPIRFRATIPTAWIELNLAEGRNRQVRRMTSAVGYPTLRLVRVSIGPWSVRDLHPGAWRDADSRPFENSDGLSHESAQVTRPPPAEGIPRRHGARTRIAPAPSRKS